MHPFFLEILAYLYAMGLDCCGLYVPPTPPPSPRQLVPTAQVDDGWTSGSDFEDDVPFAFVVVTGQVHARRVDPNQPLFGCRSNERGTDNQ